MPEPPPAHDLLKGKIVLVTADGDNWTLPGGC